MRRDRDVAEAPLVEVLAEQVAHELGREVWHEPEVDLRARDGGEDRLRSRALVARCQAADRAGRLEEVAPLERGPGQAADEAVDAVDPLPAGLVERQPLEDGKIRSARLADTVHQPVDGDLVALVLQRGEGPHQAPCGVGHDPSDGGVRVQLGAAHHEVDVADPLEPEVHRRPPGRVLVPGLPDAAVRAKAIGVRADEILQVRGPDLLLALEEDAHPQRERTDGRLVRLDGLEPGHEVALVVRRPAAEQEAVARDRLERRGRPLAERLRRLDVVVVVDEERARAAPLLADDGRWTARDALGRRGEPGARRAREDRVRRLLDRAVLRRDRRQADQGAELVEVFLLMRSNVGVERGERVRHGRTIANPGPS